MYKYSVQYLLLVLGSYLEVTEVEIVEEVVRNIEKLTTTSTLGGIQSIGLVQPLLHQLQVSWMEHFTNADDGICGGLESGRIPNIFARDFQGMGSIFL